MISELEIKIRGSPKFMKLFDMVKSEKLYDEINNTLDLLRKIRSGKPNKAKAVAKMLRGCI